MDQCLEEEKHQENRVINSRWRTFVIVASVASGFVMAMLDVTVVNVALGHIRADFHSQLSDLVWVIDGYTLTYAALLLLGGGIADRIGAKRTYLLGLAWFVTASVLCGLAWSGLTLIISRLLQGIGAALFVPSSLSLLTEAFPDNKVRARLLGIWGAIIAAAASSGPLVGGFFVSYLGWRSIFYLNVPIGILGLIVAAIVLLPSPKKKRAFDVPSHVALVATLGGLSFAFIEGPSLGWSASKVVVAGIVTLFSLSALAFREARSANPIIPRDLTRNRGFIAYNLVGFLVNFVLFGEIFVVSLLLPAAFGKSALETGLAMLPMMCMLSIMNFSSGFASVRFGLRNVMIAGFLATVIGTVATLMIGTRNGWAYLSVSLSMCNAGIGLALPAVISGLMRESGENANTGAAALNANRQIGALAGVAAVGVVLHAVPGWSQSVRMVSAGFAVCAIVATYVVHRWVRADPG